MRKSSYLKLGMFLLLSLTFLTTIPTFLLAGSLDPPGPPESTMNTLDEINDKLGNIIQFLEGSTTTIPTISTTTTTPASGGFNINGDGTVTDNNTGLIWLKDALCPEVNPDFGTGGVPYYEIEFYLTQLQSGSCGLTDGSGIGDWRLPTYDEWVSFRCNQYINPAVCNTIGSSQWTEADPFNNVESGYYWSSSTDNLSQLAWVIYLYDGNMNLFVQTQNSAHVWPVRNP